MEERRLCHWIFIRHEKKFSSIEELKSQISEDLNQAKGLLKLVVRTKVFASEVTSNWSSSISSLKSAVLVFGQNRHFSIVHGITILWVGSAVLTEFRHP